MNDDLKTRQQAGEDVEKLMLDFLLQYTPAQELKVADVKAIAFHARSIAFDCFRNL